MSRLGNTIRSLRIREKLNIEELAKIINVSRSSMGAYEIGTRIPPIDTLEKIADYFNVDMNYITAGVINEESTEYYMNLKSKQIAQEIFENKELRALFDASRDASPEDLEIVRNLLLSLKKKEGISTL